MKAILKKLFIFFLYVKANWNIGIRPFLYGKLSLKNKKQYSPDDISRKFVYFVSETLKPNRYGKEERKEGRKTHEEEWIGG